MPCSPAAVSSQVLRGCCSNSNSLRAILPPPSPPRRRGTRCWRHNFRFVLLIVGFLLCTSLSMNMGLFNFTMICMDSSEGGAMMVRRHGIRNGMAQNGNGTAQNQETNTTTSAGPQKWSRGAASFTMVEQEHLMWAMAFGTLLAALPFVRLYSQFGARRVLFYSALLSAISTALGPLATFTEFWAFAAVRFLQGITFAADFAALGMLCAQWASLDEHGIFLSLASSYSPASVMLGNSLSALFCASPLGWPAVYYVAAFLCLLLALLWYGLYQDLPQQCPNVTSRELEHIQRGKTQAHVNMGTGEKVPYLKILCNGLIWVCWLNAFVDLCSGIFIIQYKPLYFKHVLGYSVLDTGWLTALPSALHIPLKIVVGLASDRITCISERHKLILFNCISVGLPCFSFLGIAFAPNSTVAFFCFLAISMFFSAAGGGFYKCAMLTSRQFGHFIMAGIQLNKCLALFLSPALVSLFVRDQHDQAQWRTIFLIFAVLCFLANALFCWVATDEPAGFTYTRKVASIKPIGCRNFKR